MVQLWEGFLDSNDVPNTLLMLTPHEFRVHQNLRRLKFFGMIRENVQNITNVPKATKDDCNTHD